MTEPFDIAEVKASLPEWQWPIEQAFSPTPAVAQYLAFYQLDFTERQDGLRHHMGTIEHLNEQIVCHCWQPEQATGSVWLLHGYYDHVGLYSKMIKYLLDKSFAVVAFDLPGHGLSSGPRSAINCFSDYRSTFEAILELSQPHLPGPHYALGQSTGGAVIMDTLLHQQWTPDNSPFRQVILLAPLLEPHRWRQFGRFIYAGARHFIKQIPRTFTANSHDPDFINFIQKQDPLQDRTLSVQWVGAMAKWSQRFNDAAHSELSPLIFQGKQDTTVDWQKNIERIEEKFSEPEVVYLDEAKHHLPNERIDLRRRIYQRLDRLWQENRSH